MNFDQKSQRDSMSEMKITGIHLAKKIFIFSV